MISVICGVLIHIRKGNNTENGSPRRNTGANRKPNWSQQRARREPKAEEAESLARRLARRVDGETTTKLKKQQAQQEQTLKGVMRHAHNHPQTNEKEDEEAEEEEEDIQWIFLFDDDFAFGYSTGLTFPQTVEQLLRAGPSSLGQV